MPRSARPGLTASGTVLLAFVGAWLGHTLEYARLAGSQGTVASPLGPVHADMLPLAVVLSLLGALCGIRAWRAWLGLGRRLDAARSCLARVLRGHGGQPGPAVGTPLPSGGARWLALALMLAALQIGIYLVQENLEAVAAGLGPRGLEPLTGIHWMAPLLHVAVAALLASVSVAASRRLRARTRRIEVCERLVLRLLGMLAPRPPVLGRPPAPWCPSPVDRFGGTLWRRPPPSSLPAP
jgi:hypothetical protein